MAAASPGNADVAAEQTSREYLSHTCLQQAMDKLTEAHTISRDLRFREENCSSEATTEQRCARDLNAVRKECIQAASLLYLYSFFFLFHFGPLMRFVLV